MRTTGEGMMLATDEIEDRAWKEIRRRICRGESGTFRPGDTAVSALARMKEAEAGQLEMEYK